MVVVALMLLARVRAVVLPEAGAQAGSLLRKGSSEEASWVRHACPPPLEEVGGILEPPAVWGARTRAREMTILRLRTRFARRCVPRWSSSNTRQPRVDIAGPVQGAGRLPRKAGGDPIAGVPEGAGSAGEAAVAARVGIPGRTERRERVRLAKEEEEGKG